MFLLKCEIKKNVFYTSATLLEVIFLLALSPVGRPLPLGFAISLEAAMEV